MNDVEASVLEIEAADIHGTEIEPALGERQGRRRPKKICPVVDTFADNLARRPGSRLAIVGSDPTATLRAACAGEGAIEITGRVADVRERLWTSAIAVAPLRVARGLQNKVLEAVAAGLPTVVTTAVAAGLPRGVWPACPVADTPQLFADAVLDLLALTPDQRRTRAESASLEPLDWPATLEPLWSLLEKISLQ
jgi:glycosyltransferase involved in cell wall biosynthesis